MTNLLFCVVVPMYNESENVLNSITSIYSEISKIDSKSRLIVVNDGSLDDTIYKLKSIKENIDFDLVNHCRNMGYGKALMSGANRALELGSKYVIFMDSDLTNDPKDIIKFVRLMDDNPDIIKASRYSNGGFVYGVPLHRYLISKIGNIVAKFLVGAPVTDITNGFRAIKTRYLEGVNFNENGFAIITEEFCKIYNPQMKVLNIGVCLTNRDVDIRQTSFVYTPLVFWKYLKYPLKYFIRRITK